jgi:3-phenylpropionate/trans-cinnamate dioxygenase ferredoxin subunit
VAEYLEAGLLANLPPGRSTTVTLAGKGVALYNVDGTVYATDDSCLHAGASLGSGNLAGKIITGRAHGKSYDVTNGEMGGGPGVGVDTYPVKIVDGKILVAVK